MADEQLELRRINWSEAFSFSQIFKCFRMAIHPSKLLLAFAAVTLIYAGGWGLDRLWSTWGGYVDRDEIYCHFDPGVLKMDNRPVSFKEWKTAQNESRLARSVGLLVAQRDQARKLDKYLAGLPDGFLRAAIKADLDKKNQEEANWQPFEVAKILDEAKKKNESWSSKLSAAGDEFSTEVKRAEAFLSTAITEAKKEIDKIDKKEDKEKAQEEFKKEQQLALQGLTERKREFHAETAAIRGRPIFDSLLQYEWNCISNAVAAVRHGNITGGLNVYRTQAQGGAVQPIATGSNQAVLPAPVPADNACGFLYWVLLSVQGVRWLISEHWLYAIIFLLWCLILWALFGGAIHRIAALHAAREEKISMSQAVKFATGKFLSFFTAPLLPLGIIFVLGFFLFLGGLIGNIMGFGAILIGMLFFLALILGLLIAFLLVGLVSGFGLMYPTIAVEGSDSFDAISRSFSYVFARPWRAALYSLVALVYGVICYLFVRLFAFLALASTHYFVRWGLFTGGDTLSAEANKLDVMWTAPRFDSLHGPWSWQAMSTCETIGAGFIWVYVFIVAGLVASFLITYFASSTTVIYYLLRQKVDATDLDDVYVEEAEEPLAPVKLAEGEAPVQAEVAEPAKPADQTGGEQKPQA